MAHTEAADVVDGRMRRMGNVAGDGDGNGNGGGDGAGYKRCATLYWRSNCCGHWTQHHFFMRILHKLREVRGEVSISRTKTIWAASGNICCCLCRCCRCDKLNEITAIWMPYQTYTQLWPGRSRQSAIGEERMGMRERRWENGEWRRENCVRPLPNGQLQMFALLLTHNWIINFYLK